jgi:hypothetical protein
MTHDEDTTAEFKGVQAALKALEDGQKQADRVRPLHVAWRTLLWFALPFGAMWGLGVEPVTAARAAVAPMAIAGFTAMFVGGFMAMMSALARSWLDTDAQIADLKARLRLTRKLVSDRSS